MKSQHIVKFTFESTTRRVPFPAQPTWAQLAAHIHTHHEIPLHVVALKYTDADGDEVTINTDEELQEYYDSEPKTVKFTVCRLQDASPPRDDPDGSRKTHRKEVQQENELSDGDESDDQDSQRSPVALSKQHTHSASPTASDEVETTPAKGKGKKTKSPTKRGGSNKRRNGRRGGQVSAASTERPAHANQTRGDRHQGAPAGGSAQQSASEAHGRNRRDDEEDDDEENDGGSEDDDDACNDDVPDISESFSVSLDINDNNTSDDSGDDSCSSAPSSGGEGGSRRRGKKGGRRQDQASQQDAGMPFGGQNAWPNFGSPGPIWPPFGSQMGGQFSMSGSSHGHGRHARGSFFGSEEAASHFPGFDFNTWQATPNPLMDMFVNFGGQRR